MAAVLKHWREAASLILITPSRLSPATLSHTKSIREEWESQQGTMERKDPKVEYDTLLLKRSSKSRFMPNLYVFPGGTAVNDDFSSEWISVFERLGKDFQESIFEKVTRGRSKSSPMFTRPRDPEYALIPPEVAFRICAIRETFEESGILLVKKVKEMKDQEKGLLSINQWKSPSCLPADDLELIEWRKRVNENPNDFLIMCKEMDFIPDILSMYEWTNWLTPTLMGGKRFDTIFYICCLDHKPETKEDSSETVEHQWISPPALLSSHYNRQGIQLAPPQVYEVSRMLNFGKSEELMQFAAERECERVERIFPVIVFTEGHIVSLLPGDDLYPENPDLYTPKQMIQYNETLQEINKRTTHFHRSVSLMQEKGSGQRGLESIYFNLVFENRHVGPVIRKADGVTSGGKL